MRTRLVYMDFGDGFANVSDYVKYETLKYSRRGFNDSYRYAQNDCSFSLIYDVALWNSIRSATTDIQVRIVDLTGNATITAENDWFLITENSFEIAAETDIAVPVFYGHAKPTKARTYTGNLNEMFIQIRATDEIDLFSIPVGDIVYADCAVLDPLNPDTSIVHKLALIAGWTTGMVSTSVTISTVIPRFSPPDSDATVLEVLNDLLYEYGYVFNLDESGVISPVKWNVEDALPTITFNDSNCIKSVQIEDTIKEYDSATVVYYELAQAQKIRLFTDGNCGYNDDGSYAGVPILNNTYYPPEANVIDDTTGTNQVVEQEYTDESIKYFTNKAIKENLDYSYKAFSSDFSAIVATEDHFADARVDSGVTVTRTFGNKKCRLLYRNTTGSTKYLWYNNVYGTVWYKSAERTSKRSIGATPKKEYKYTSRYIFDKTTADTFVKGLTAQYEVGRTQYTVLYDTSFVPGTICRITLGDGTDQACIVRESSWDEYTQLHTLKLQSCSLDRGDITARTSTVKVNVIPASPFSLILSVKQLNIPYVGTTPDFSSTYIDIKIVRDNIDVTADWSLSATPSAVTGTLSGTRYSVTGISSTIGAVTITASNATWGTIQDTVVVIRATGAEGPQGPQGPQGEPGTSVVLKGTVTDYTALPTSGVSVGDLYIVQNAGGGYLAGDGAVVASVDPSVVWQNVGQIRGPDGSDGAPGADGTSSYMHIRYSASADGTNFSTTPNTYIGTAVTTSAVAPTDKSAYTWSKFIGYDGINAATVYLYQRSSSGAPAKPSYTVRYTFSTGAATKTDGSPITGWSQSIPSGTAPIYVTTASAIATGTYDDILTTEWAAVQLYAENGADGAKTAIVYLYKRSATTPALPTGTLTYTFASRTLSGALNGWSQLHPTDEGDNNPIYITASTAYGTGDTDTIASTDWSSPVVLSRKGDTGTSVYTANIYKQISPAPTAPSGGTFNFSTNTLTPPTGWVSTPPASSTTPTYACTYRFTTTNPTATVTAGTWTGPFLYVQNGSDGANAVIMTSASSPAGTVTGQLGYYDGRLYKWSGSAWVVQDTNGRYLGRYTSHPTAKEGDWWLIYGLYNNATTRGFYVRRGSVNEPVSGLSDALKREYTSSGLEDVLWASNNGYALTSDLESSYNPVAVYGVSTMEFLAVNQAFIKKLVTQELQFQEYVASIAGNTLVPRSGSTPGTQQIYMGKNPRYPNDVTRAYEFALQEYLGMDGTKEVWMKHFWTRMLASGVAALTLTGCVQANDGVLSQPGVVWKDLADPFGSSTVFCIAYGNGKWVAVGQAGKIAYSTDGQTFTLGSSPFGTSNVFGIAYGNGKWIAVGDDGKIAYSTNGQTFTLGTIPFGTSYAYGIAYGNGKWVAVGQAGKIAYSTDGQTFTLGSSPFGTSNVFGIAYGNGKWIAVGDSGKIAYSTDGQTFVLGTSPFGTSLVLGIAYGNGKWVAVCYDGKIAYSTDGQTFVLGTSPFGTSSVFGIAYGNGKWVAVGDSGKIAYSTDGIVFGSNNLQQPFGVKGWFESVACNEDGVFIAVGYLYDGSGGLIIRSDPLEAGGGVVGKVYDTARGELNKLWDGRYFPSYASVDEIAPKKYFRFPAGTTHAAIFQAISPLLPTFGGRGVGAAGHYNGYAINCVWFSTANTHITFKESAIGDWLTITNTTGATITAALYVELLDTV